MLFILTKEIFDFSTILWHQFSEEMCQKNVSLNNEALLMRGVMASGMEKRGKLIKGKRDDPEGQQSRYEGP
jgi:hypothetical protein